MSAIGLVDTHCHLHFPDFDADRDAVVKRALDAGIHRMVNVGTDEATNVAAWQVAKQYPCMVHTAGLHPHHSHEVSEEGIAAIEKFIAQTKPAAIGEIGLDYFKSQADAETQKRIFRRMLALAQAHDLPVIVHSRNAFEDTYAVLKEESRGRLRGVMHCYSYDVEALRKLLDLGFLASFTANVTYKNTQALLEAACFAPLDRIMLETDAPYLAPQVHRGKRNEPSFLKEAAVFLSQKRQITLDALSEQTTQNAEALFGVGRS